MQRGLVGSEMCIRDRYQRRVHGSNVELDQLFARLDTNNSGSISYSEFLNGTLDLNKVLNDAILKETFAYFDRDGNQTLDKIEISNALKKCYISSTQMSELFKSVDTNGDNIISYKEFEEMVSKLSKKVEEAQR
eukprot:TRINITY_DN961_c0_g1_i2.p1 TRINITY_DN961_c0_g1~~TRINITY_DN961_c0_g1_i2.p1  ORF type:complete len:134 (-),score=33.04 TRINITY_DN961_c0_g1_i2:198-599(-)